MKNKENTSSNTFRINTAKCLQQVKDLLLKILELVKNIKFWNIQSNFQTKLNEDIKTIRESEKTLTQADKTSNIYKLSKDEYNNLLTSAITLPKNNKNKQIFNNPTVFF